MDAEVLKSIRQSRILLYHLQQKCLHFFLHKNISISCGRSVACGYAITNIDDSETYVIVDESSVEEFELPDSVALPIGNKRVKIKTEIIISLVGPLLYHLSHSSKVNITRETLEAEQQYYESKLEKNGNKIKYWKN